MAPIHNSNGGSRFHIDGLYDAILELIFAKLSSWKNLARSKCVSKRWNSIISDPCFTRHLTHNQLPSTLYFGGSNCEVVISEHPYFVKHNNLNLDFVACESIEIVAYHNDVFVSFGIQKDEPMYYIANPLTKKFIVVPILPTRRIYYRDDNELVSYRHLIYGRVGIVGFVNGVSTFENTNNILGFRIVRIYYNCLKFCGYIYSSETGQWKTYQLDRSMLRRNRVWFNEGISWNNKVYWHGCGKILVVDPFSDDIKPYCVHDLPIKIAKESSLGVCRNRLRITQFCKNDLRIRVWEFMSCNDLTIGITSENNANLSLIVDLYLLPSLVYDVVRYAHRVHPDQRRNNYAFHEDQVICCHPNNPDVFYFKFVNTLIGCDIAKMTFRKIFWDIGWGKRFVLVSPLTAP